MNRDFSRNRDFLLILRLIDNLAYLFTEEFVVDNIYGKFCKIARAIKARYTLTTKLNSSRSTLLKVDKVDRVVLAPNTLAIYRRDVQHSGNKVDRIGNSVETS